MLGRIHCIYPQALVLVLVIATFLHFNNQKKAHKPQRLGTMLWVYMFAITLELSYSLAFLGSVECDVALWYLYCSVLGVLGLAVLLRDRLINSIIALMTRDEEGLTEAQSKHRALTFAGMILCIAFTLCAILVPTLIFGVDSQFKSSETLLSFVGLVAGGFVILLLVLKLGHNSGLGPALVAIVLGFIGLSRSYAISNTGSFAFPQDSLNLLSELLDGSTSVVLSWSTLISIMFLGAAVAACSVIFRLPQIVYEDTTETEDGAVTVDAKVDVDAEDGITTAATEYLTDTVDTEADVDSKDSAVTAINTK